MKQMARRPLVRFPDGSVFNETLDKRDLGLPLTRHERVQMYKGYAIAFVGIALFVCAMALAGGSR